LADEHVGDVTISTQVIEYNQNFLQANPANQIEIFKSIIYIYIYGERMWSGCGRVEKYMPPPQTNWTRIASERGLLKISVNETDTTTSGPV
jgi:hypothetical protein